MKKLTFNSEEELLEFLPELFSNRTLIDNGVYTLNDFTDSELEREIEKRGYHYFEDDWDIQSYVEDNMGLYVFGDENEVIDWVKMTSDELYELSTTAQFGAYKSDCVDRINELVEEHGWEWLHRRLELM